MANIFGAWCAGRGSGEFYIKVRREWGCIERRERVYVTRVEASVCDVTMAV